MNADERKRLKITIAGEAFTLLMLVLASLATHTWRETWLMPSTIVWAISLVIVTIVWLRRARRTRSG